MLSIIARQSARLATIVDEILVPAQLEAGELHLYEERVDVADVARRALAAAQARTHTHRLGADLRDAAPVVADATKLEQVLSNLVDNAVKYSPPDTAIHVSVEQQHGRVVVRVRDEGPGIPPPERKRVFEKFYRLDPDHASGVRGTGLGLYICRELVLRMGGEIWVEPDGGRGSTFAIALPAARTERLSA